MEGQPQSAGSEARNPIQSRPCPWSLAEMEGANDGMTSAQQCTEPGQDGRQRRRKSGARPPAPASTGAAQNWALNMLASLQLLALAAGVSARGRGRHALTACARGRPPPQTHSTSCARCAQLATECTVFNDFIDFCDAGHHQALMECCAGRGGLGRGVRGRADRRCWRRRSGGPRPWGAGDRLDQEGRDMAGGAAARGRGRASSSYYGR